MTVTAGSSYVVRPLQQDDRGPALDVVWRAFGWGLRQDEVDEVFTSRSVEAERTLITVDTQSDDEIVGTTSVA